LRVCVKWSERGGVKRVLVCVLEGFVREREREYLIKRCLEIVCAINTIERERESIRRVHMFVNREY